MPVGMRDAQAVVLLQCSTELAFVAQLQHKSEVTSEYQEAEGFLQRALGLHIHILVSEKVQSLIYRSSEAVLLE